MALLPQHKYFVYNEKIFPVDEFISSENEGGIYEVLRVEQGIPLFLEDHLRRFFHSAEIAGKTIRFSAEEIKTFLNHLIESNNQAFGNILISCKENLKAFFIPHNYPASELYKNGAVCGVLHAERENPNAKVFQTSVREKANELIRENNYYEVMLVDHFGRITEGSRSNVFFVKDDILITPPGNEVLLGITRQKTIRLARTLNIEIREEDVHYNALLDYSGAFITGTSPKILPIRTIHDNSFGPALKIIISLMKGYDNLIKEYVSKKN